MDIEHDSIVAEIDKEIKFLKLRKRVDIAILKEVLDSDFKIRISVYSQDGSEELFRFYDT